MSPEFIAKGKNMLEKVPEILIYFWIIKILSTTVGETAADYLNGFLNLGLTTTTFIMGALLLVILFFQFRAREYVPSFYWTVVVLMSIVGTLITDNLTDNLGVSLELTTTLFAIALIVVFVIWFRSEKTLSVHTINTTKRETFYWLAILFTFALGTAAGDLVAEQFEIGYLFSLIIFAALIAIVAVIHFTLKPHEVTTFWIAYIFTRPLGASLGDYLTQLPDDGGLGLGTTAINVIFFAVILALVTYLTITKKDKISLSEEY